MPTRAAPASNTTRLAFSQTKISTPILGILGILAFIAVWELASRLELVNSTYLPPFTEVAVTVVEVVFGEQYRAQF